MLADLESRDRRSGRDHVEGVGFPGVGPEFVQFAIFEHEILRERDVDGLQNVYVLAAAQSALVDLAAPGGESLLCLPLFLADADGTPSARAFPDAGVQDVGHDRLQVELHVQRAGNLVPCRARLRLRIDGRRRPRGTGSDDRSNVGCDEVTAIHSRSPFGVSIRFKLFAWAKRIYGERWRHPTTVRKGQDVR